MTPVTAEGTDGVGPAYYGPASEGDEPWNPGEDTLAPNRGRHRVSRQRGGTMARSRAVLGVGVIAAVGAGGMATANEGGAGSVPGMGAASDTMSNIPVVGSLLAGDTEEAATVSPFTAAGMSDEQLEAGETDAGEALRARILQQADFQEAGAAAQTRSAALQAAEVQAAEGAAELAEEQRLAEEERQREIEEERQRQEEERRLAELRASYTLPLNSYRLTSTYGQSGSLWSSGSHTGLDFAAPTGTPISNIHTGTVLEAAWAGSYGYRVIVEQEDGTEVWYNHLSSMSVSAGQQVDTGDQIGLVGATGNVTGAHLHLEVRPGGGATIDPLSWLRGKGQSI
ncbi:M23 family metallopeptidase [Streptomyces mayteni]